MFARQVAVASAVALSLMVGGASAQAPAGRAALIVGTVIQANDGSAVLSAGTLTPPCGLGAAPRICMYARVPTAPGIILAAHRVRVNLRRAAWDTAWGTPLHAAPRLEPGERLAVEGRMVAGPDTAGQTVPVLDARVAVVIAPVWPMRRCMFEPCGPLPRCGPFPLKPAVRPGFSHGAGVKTALPVCAVARVG